MLHKSVLWGCRGRWRPSWRLATHTLWEEKPALGGWQDHRTPASNGHHTTSPPCHRRGARTANKQGIRRAEEEAADHLLLPHLRFHKVREALAEGEKCLNGTRVCCYSVTQSCPSLCNPMYCRLPGFPALHHLWSLLKLMSIELVMPFDHPILNSQMRV